MCIVAGSRPTASHAATNAWRLARRRVDVAPRVPLVGVAGGEAQHPRAGGADQDRQWRLDRLRVGRRVGDRVDRPVERGPLLGRAVTAMIWIASLEALDALARAARARCRSAWCSLICQPAPSPSTIRPFEMWSTVVARLASTRRVVDRRRRHQRAEADPLGDARRAPASIAQHSCVSPSATPSSRCSACSGRRTRARATRVVGPVGRVAAMSSQLRPGAGQTEKSTRARP